MRRSTDEKVLQVQLASSPSSTLLAASSGMIVKPVKFVVAATTAAETSITSNGVAFGHLNVAADSSDNIDFPNGFELAIGSGVAFVTDNNVDVTFFYSLYDERTPISKEAARAATCNSITVTRTPNQFGGQAKT